MRLLELSITNFRGFGPKRTDIDLSADLILLYESDGESRPRSDSVIGGRALRGKLGLTGPRPFFLH